MLVVNKHIYDWFVSSKYPKLGRYIPTKGMDIHKIVNINAGCKIEQVSLMFLTTNRCRQIGIEKYLTGYYNQEESHFVPECDPRRLLAGRLLRKYKKKHLHKQKR